MQAAVADPRLSSTDALNLWGLWWANFLLAAAAECYIVSAMALKSTLFSRTRATTGSAVHSQQRGDASPAGEGRRARIVAITPRVLNAAYSG
jgi:hypothetical protein